MRKNLAIILVALVAIGSLSFAASYAQAVPLIGRNMFNHFAGAYMANKPIHQSWVQINGIVAKWGSTNATGFFTAQTRTTLFNNSNTRQLSPASATWTTDKFRPLLNAVKTKENLTYTIYSARLMNASVATLNYEGNDFYMNGTWHVNTVTITITLIIDDEGNISRVNRNTDIVSTKAYGELNVTNNWTKFTLTINGIDPLAGPVRRSVIRQMQFNPFKITDDLTGTTSDTVTKADLTAMAKCYGTMPGWGNYEQKMDFNFNYRIDIADLATVAANME